MLVSSLSLSARVDSFLGRQPGGPPLAVIAVCRSRESFADMTRDYGYSRKVPVAFFAAADRRV